MSDVYVHYNNNRVMCRYADHFMYLLTCMNESVQH